MRNRGIIVGLSGLARSGKNATATIIREFIPTAEEIAFADPIKTIGRKLFDFNDEQAYGKLKEIPDQRYPRPCETCGGEGKQVDDEVMELTFKSCNTCAGTGKLLLTPRWAYQFIGTELGRALYPDVWVDYALRYAQDMLSGNLMKLGPDSFALRDVVAATVAPRPKIILITDLRFINEAKKVKNAGGFVWRIDRPGNISKLSEQAKQHRSETEQQTSEFLGYIDHTITNSGTFDDLKNKVKEALTAFELL